MCIPRKLLGIVVVAGLLTALAFLAKPRAAAGNESAVTEVEAAEFREAVGPVLEGTCFACHNDHLASGGLSMRPFLSPNSVSEHRDAWEMILHRIQTGEMPPPGIPRPPEAQMAALRDFIQDLFEKADRDLHPDPGRVTARRLNRNEYSNTVRDLLAVEFRADRQFPSDDSGYGFDNIGDVLTVSPLLMEQYLIAAERIAARAVGAEPLPSTPLEFEYHSKHRNIRRPDRSTIETTHSVDWDGEYLVRFGMPGERSEDAPPVTLGFWMDGRLLDTIPVETKPSGLIYFDPYSEAEMKVYLPEGTHTFRAGFIDDDFLENLPEEDLHNRKKNKFLNSMVFIGPFPSQVEKASRKKILVCDPSSGPGCVETILSGLARRAYRRPVTDDEVRALLRFVELARHEGQSVEQGIQLAIQAMLVSPHFLFRVEVEPDPKEGEGIRSVSDLELASRLSYFLWSSMPDDRLLELAEAARLREPGVLKAEVERMLDDPRSAALAENFAGQWLEIRSLDRITPDPDRFPEWGLELREAMKTETQMFFDYLLRQNRPILDFLDARFTFLNERLARHYGIEGVRGADFRRVDLDGAQRGGVLTHASVLTVSSYATRTSPVIRGKYVLQNILGAPPPEPPPNVPALDEEAVGNTGSLRQQMEQHRTNPICASCHNRMDALGFGLENYDAIGKWRTMDGRFPIEAGGTLPNGRSFTSPAELRALLMEDIQEFARCLTEKMLTYALGRGLERFDRPTVTEITRSLQASDYRFQTLIHEIVQSLPFQSRRAEARPSPTAAKPQEVARQ